MSSSRTNFAAFGLRDVFADGRAGLIIKVACTAWPFFGRGEQQRSHGVLIRCGKRAGFGDRLMWPCLTNETCGSGVGGVARHRRTARPPTPSLPTRGREPLRRVCDLS
jgi:hypothetical protein